MKQIRPFPTRELIRRLALVSLRCNTMNEELIKGLTEHAWEVTPWRQSLHYQMDALDAIVEAAMSAREQCEQLFEFAEDHHEMAQKAALAFVKDQAEREQRLVEQRRQQIRVVEGGAA